MARQITRIALLVLVVFCASPVASRAQQVAVRVTEREAAVHTRPDRRSPIVGRAVAGTVLVVTATENNWYRVVITPQVRLVPTAPEQGYVETREVELLPPGDPRAAAAAAALPARGKLPGAVGKVATGGPRLAWRVFGLASLERFQAANSFEAVFGSASAPVFGGGLDVLVGRRLFVEGEVGYVRQTGERVFVFEGEVFPVGIGERMQLTTVAANAGYRFGKSPRVLPYAGGGVVLGFYSEEALGVDAAAGGDGSLSRNGVGAQALGGVELGLSRWFSVAVQARYRYLPGILGKDGVSQEYSEDNLGGAAVGVKLLIGRRR